jgi:hypothetical protein
MASIIADEDVDFCKRLGEHGLALVRDIHNRKAGGTVNILTHCNAGACKHALIWVSPSSKLLLPIRCRVAGFRGRWLSHCPNICGARRRHPSACLCRRNSSTESGSQSDCVGAAGQHGACAGALRSVTSLNPDLGGGAEARSSAHHHR